MPVQGNLSADLQMIVLQLWPHQSGGRLHDLPQWLGLGHHHAGTVVEPQRSLVVPTNHQSDALVTSEVHVEIVRVGPLEVGQHRHLLLYDLVLLGFLSQRFGSCLFKLLVK